MLFTRQTIPSPSSVSSFIQLFTPIPVMSAGVSVAVLSLSFSCRLSASTGIFRSGVRL